MNAGTIVLASPTTPKRAGDREDACVDVPIAGDDCLRPCDAGQALDSPRDSDHEIEVGPTIVPVKPT
jgi:hypothetical protein